MYGTDIHKSTVNRPKNKVSSEMPWNRFVVYSRIICKFAGFSSMEHCAVVTSCFCRGMLRPQQSISNFPLGVRQKLLLSSCLHTVLPLSQHGSRYPYPLSDRCNDRKTSPFCVLHGRQQVFPRVLRISGEDEIKVDALLAASINSYVRQVCFRVSELFRLWTWFTCCKLSELK